MKIRHARPTTHPAAARRNTRPLLFAAATAGGVLAGASVAVAATTVYVRGKTDMISQPLTGDLQVLDAHLDPMLLPGGTSGLVLRVRNRAAKPVTLDRVTLVRPLRSPTPSTCAGKLSGPLMATAGMPVPTGQRIRIPAGRDAAVTIPAVIKLASSATKGCGFRVTVQVQAVQDPPSSPTLTPSTNPTSTSPAASPSQSVPPSTPPSGS